MSKFKFNYHKTKSDAPQTRVAEAMVALDTTKVRVILISVAVVFSLLYLWLVNSTATAGFYLSDLEDNVYMLEEEYRRLEIEQTALRSLDHVQERSEAMGMVASGTVEYVSADTAVAFVDGE